MYLQWADLLQPEFEAKALYIFSQSTRIRSSFERIHDMADSHVQGL